jgi:hypothetical protein
MGSRDELAEALADSINKNSDGKVAFFLMQKTILRRLLTGLVPETVWLI